MSNPTDLSQNNLIGLFGEYLQECEFSTRLRPATIRGYKAVFALFLDLMPEITSIEFLTSAFVVDFFKRLQVRKRIVGRSTIKCGVRDSTIKTYWSKLNSFFEWLVRKGHLERNPLHDLKRPPEPRYEDSKALKDHEVDKVLAAIISHTSNPLALRRDIVIVSLLLYCGLRRGELISLQVKDIDLFKATITVRGETSKSKKTRMLPLHPMLLMHLKDYMAERTRCSYKTEHLLVSTNHDDAGLTRSGLRHWEKRLVRISGINFHLHRFRHTFATNLARKDVGIVKIQKLLGHYTAMVNRTAFETKALRKIGTRISNVRETKGMKQAQLAGKCAMGKSSIYRLEAGVANPTIVTLSRIAQALGVGLKDLIVD